MRILWLKTEVLHPVDKGGRIRTYNMLRLLKRNHQITYVTLDNGSAKAEQLSRAAEYCHELVCIPHRERLKFTPGFYAELLLNVTSSLPFAIKKYQAPLMGQEIVQRMRSGVDILICDFLAPAVNVPAKVPCATILFQHNVEAMIWKRHYEVQTNPIKKSYLFAQWKKMQRFEGAMCRQFDSVIAVSPQDCELMQQQYLTDRVFAVPTGVDTDFYRPSGKESVEPHNLVFTGSMDWLPNEDAIRYFIDQTMPLIKKEVPGVTLTVVGRDPYPALVELSRRDPSLIVTGRVDDVRPYIERAAVYVVPLRIGGGTRLKIFEALAMEKAIVSTTIGAEGLPVKHRTELLLADTPKAFADSVVKLISDRRLAHELGANGAKTVRDQFGWHKATERFEEICAATIWARGKSMPVDNGDRAKGSLFNPMAISKSLESQEHENHDAKLESSVEAVSVIIPCYNEERFIGTALQNLANQYEAAHYEIIIVDGMSEDSTRKIIDQFVRSHPEISIRIIDNFQRTIPRGINLGVAAARGQIIARIDAHAVASENYIRRCVEVLKNNEAAVVGMPCHVRAGAETIMAAAIATAVSHPFGIGDAKYRLASGNTLQEPVDTVAFACFKKSLWQELGGFNEDLLTNEDYDFNYRVRVRGGRVLLDRSGHCDYFARTTLRSLAAQYYRYGGWKARMLRLHPRSVRLRHVVAPLFIVSIILLGLVGLRLKMALYLLALELASYASLAFFFGWRATEKAGGGFSIMLLMPLVFLTIHSTWGCSFLLQLINSSSSNDEDRCKSSIASA